MRGKGHMGVASVRKWEKSDSRSLIYYLLLSAKAEKFSAKTEIFFVNFSEF
jgi:hypothetical protein